MAHAANWFEIPVSDFVRAKKFYETIFAIQLTVMEVGPKLGLFPADLKNGEVGGAIAFGKGYTATAEGTKVYLNGGEDLGKVLDRVEAAGGKVAVPKIQISPEFGYMGAFIDTEGNWVGLHSRT